MPLCVSIKGKNELISIVRGKELVGLEYTGPYDHFEAQKIKGGYPFSNKANNKTSGKAKLKSGDALTDAEISALFGD